ncbi:MAG TPA: RNA polymerase sigma factor [Longimicrobiales bacterium]
MNLPLRQLRTPEERVGRLPNASLPPPPEPGTISDEDRLLLSALRDGDESAFAQVLDTCFSSMLRLALSHVNDRASAEEVVQETWLAAIEGIGRFEGRSTVKTWLFHILRNIARSRGRRDDRLRPLSALQSADAAAAGIDPLDRIVDARSAASGHGRAALWAGHNPDPEAELLAAELWEQLETTLATLPPRQREVIVLRDVDGWSAAEVCNILGITDTNQRVLLHRARERVRHDLRQYLSGSDICRDEHDDDLP